jgi:hypothetical protein
MKQKQSILFLSKNVAPEIATGGELQMTETVGWLLKHKLRERELEMVGTTGLEPATSTVSR